MRVCVRARRGEEARVGVDSIGMRAGGRGFWIQPAGARVDDWMFSFSFDARGRCIARRERTRD